MSLEAITHAVNVRRDGEVLVTLDQTLLPNVTEYLNLTTAEEMWEAIYSLRVRGAPAIGIFAGYAMAILAKKIPAPDFDTFYAEYSRLSAYLNSSRPTAVNLSCMLKRMDKVVLNHKEASHEALLEALDNEAKAIHDEDIAMCRKISEYGLSLLKDGDGVITHCNAGPIATSRYGTAQGPFFLSKETGMKLHVYVDETRPLLQGARLTSYELTKAGVDCTLICDNMASIVMKQGKVQAVFFGCDRIARNGDVANKIGSSGLAIIANHYGIPVYSLGPSTTIDFSCPSGDHIPIEERPHEEIKELFYLKPMALPEVKCYNPAFDVTDHSLLAGIVTERGIVRPPFAENFAKMFPEEMGNV
ncbi:MAG: S-methyl-5-thioribose-1-phosphate isomerase [Ruminococcaceae bacterium]|nr:S-methyl-5-thioribose-1-phosphate isomerase [Oscillospiraceae bacterium]